MANIKGLAGAGEYGEIEDYVRRMDETMQELEYKYVTGNAVTDVIINDKYRRAEKAGIRFDSDFRYGGEIPGIRFRDYSKQPSGQCHKSLREVGTGKRVHTSYNETEETVSITGCREQF